MGPMARRQRTAMTLAEGQHPRPAQVGARSAAVFHGGRTSPSTYSAGTGLLRSHVVRTKDVLLTHTIMTPEVTRWRSWFSGNRFAGLAAPLIGSRAPAL